MTWMSKDTVRFVLEGALYEAARAWVRVAHATVRLAYWRSAYETAIKDTKHPGTERIAKEILDDVTKEHFQSGVVYWTTEDTIVAIFRRMLPDRYMSKLYQLRQTANDVFHYLNWIDINYKNDVLNALESERRKMRKVCADLAEWIMR